MKNCPSIRNRMYHPTLWMPSAMSQCAYGGYYDPSPDVEYECNDVIIKDNGKV